VEDVGASATVDLPIGRSRLDVGFPMSMPRRLRGDRGVGELRMPVILGVGVALVLIVLVAVQLASGAASQSDKPKVLVLGDSITDRGQQALKDELGPLYSLSMDGKTSFRTDQQMPSAERWSSREFEQVVLNLGTNDVIQGSGVDQGAQNLAAMVAMFPQASCVHLVTINEMIPREASPTAMRDAKALNEQVRALAAADPRIRIVDWAAIVSDEYAAGTNPTMDGVHPTEEGYEALASAYRTSLDTCPAA
jgi:hypothetical protein